MIQNTKVQRNSLITITYPSFWASFDWITSWSSMNWTFFKLWNHSERWANSGDLGLRTLVIQCPIHLRFPLRLDLYLYDKGICLKARCKRRRCFWTQLWTCRCRHHTLAAYLTQPDFWLLKMCKCYSTSIAENLAGEMMGQWDDEIFL